MRLYRAIVIFPLLAALVTGLPIVHAQPTDTALLDTYLEGQIAAQRVPGLVLALAYADGTTDVRTYGEAAPGEAITATTRFRIGSLSKAMTAAAVIQLVEAGLVNLDAPVQTYLPDFTTQNPDWARQITVRHLLNQTSGLTDRGYVQLVSASAPADLIRSFADARHDAEPGRQFTYFNGNYALLGPIISRVSGRSYDTYLRERIFTPAGMADALIAVEPDAPARLAQGHILLYGFPIAYAEAVSADAPSGGIVASGADLAAFLRQFVIADPEIFRADSRTILLTAPAAVDTAYAMGWFASADRDGGRMFTHSGDTLTFHADMALLPAEGIALALLYNRQNLLSAFTTYPAILNGVIAILQGRNAPGSSLSASLIGIALLMLSVLIIVNDVRRLLAGRRWAERARGQSPLRRGLSLALLLFPLYVLLWMPTLALTLTGRAVDHHVLIAYLPDIMLLLAITAALSVLTVAARLIAGWRRTAPRMKTEAE